MAHLGSKTLGLHEGGDDADALAGDAVLQVLAEVDGEILGRSVIGVATRAHQRIHGERHIGDRAAKGAHLI